MAEYAPLQFVNNVKSFFTGAPGTGSEDLFNHYGENDKLHQSVWIFSIANVLTKNNVENTDRFISLLKSVKKDIVKFLGVRDILELDMSTLYHYLMSVQVAYAWRQNKISYKVDEELIQQFVEMDLPKSIITDYATKQPADVYYIDVSEYGDVLRPGLRGMFVSLFYDIADYVVMRIMLYTPSLLKAEDNDLFTVHMLIPTTQSNLALDVDLFDGVDCEGLNTQAMYRFLYNFIIYLHAANRDVEISERTRANHTRATQTIKDKFREIKEFEVGVRYGTDVRKNRVRYKYTREQSTDATYEKRKLSSHYRTAHWHRYWVGTGDNKELITKWIEGIFVKGNYDTDDVVIHKVIFINKCRMSTDKPFTNLIHYNAAVSTFNKAHVRINESKPETNVIIFYLI